MKKKACAIFTPQKDFRFSDKEKNKLFACIEAYFTVFDRRYYNLYAPISN